MLGATGYRRAFCASKSSILPLNVKRLRATRVLNAWRSDLGILDGVAPNAWCSDLRILDDVMWSLGDIERHGGLGILGKTGLVRLDELSVSYH